MSDPKSPLHKGRGVSCGPFDGLPLAGEGGLPNNRLSTPTVRAQVTNVSLDAADLPGALSCHHCQRLKGRVKVTLSARAGRGNDWNGLFGAVLTTTAVLTAKAFDRVLKWVQRVGLKAKCTAVSQAPAQCSKASDKSDCRRLC